MEAIKEDFLYICAFRRVVPIGGSVIVALPPLLMGVIMSLIACALSSIDSPSASAPPVSAGVCDFGFRVGRVFWS